MLFKRFQFLGFFVYYISPRAAVMKGRHLTCSIHISSAAAVRCMSSESLLATPFINRLITDLSPMVFLFPWEPFLLHYTYIYLLLCCGLLYYPLLFFALLLVSANGLTCQDHPAPRQTSIEHKEKN